MSSTIQLTGTAVAVLLGFGALISAVFYPNIDLGSRLILGFLGIIMVWLGLRFSGA